MEHPAIAEPAGSAGPAFRRRREIGAASARSLLLTVLGEFVLPGGEPVWTAALLRTLGAVGVEEKATRQALARTAAEGWVEPLRHGRRTAWALTAGGRRLLTEGAERIYGFGAPARSWDGRWLLVAGGPPDGDPRLRHRLRTRLAWSGLGRLQPGLWVSPHVAREPEVVATLDALGVRGTMTLFRASVGLGDPRQVAAVAWDLAELELRYAEFLAGLRRLRPQGADETLAAQIRLVQEWRRFPFLDPGLPPELLPADWPGTKAATLFRDRHAAWKPAADAAWRGHVPAG